MSDLNRKNEEDKEISFPREDYKNKDEEDYYRGAATIAHQPFQLAFGSNTVIKNGTGTGSSQIMTIGPNIPFAKYEVEVIGAAQKLSEETKVDVANKEEDQLETEDNEAPTYDEFQSQMCKYSETAEPSQMKKAIKKILEKMPKKEKVDYYLEKDFVFVGRAYCEDEDCGFRISIFSPSERRKNIKSVVDVRRNGGTGSVFLSFKKTFLKKLKEDGLIKEEIYEFQDNEEEIEDKVYEPEKSYNIDDLVKDFQFEHVSFEDEKDFKKDEKENNDTEPNGEGNVNEDEDEEEDEEEDPEDIVKRALDKNLETFELRRNIFKLKEEVEEDEDYATLDNILEKLMDLIDDNKNFDALVTVTVLEIIEKLIYQKAKIPDRYGHTVKKVKKRWGKQLKKTVISKSGTITEFFFSPSQKVETKCDEILDLL